VGFRINTNLSAMNALRNLNMNEIEFAKSVTRLSTGLRIASAGDDPAGLIISESLRAQIASIDQAVRNAQDANSFAKTAEGALDEVNRLLRDARALAVSASNTGVLDSAALQASQTQINSIIDSINRIAATTEFNGKKLLNGSSGVTASVTDTAKLAAIQIGGTFGGYAVQSDGVVSVALITSATRASATLDVTYTSLSSIVSAGTIVLNGVSITTDGTETLQDVINKINLQSGTTGVTAEASTTGSTTVVKLNQTKYGSNYDITFYDKNDLLLAADSTTATARDAAVNVTIYTSNGATTVAFTGGRSSTDTGLRVTDTYGNVLLLTENGNANIATTAAVLAQITAGTAQFQIGPNNDSTVNLALSNIGASNLGTTAIAGESVSSVDITTAAGASNALDVLDAAIEQVSSLRADIGSFQRNVIESNIRSLGVARENLSATESQIRDLDVAAEITNFTKLQILQQSGLAVLAQANAAPQSVLQLL
jgi:flagellin